jgi:23S rRNA (guanosine2251-2'-O)-methyltransferase
VIHLEGRIAVEAALEVGRRRIEVVLLKAGAHEEKLGGLLAAAKRRAVAVKRVDAAELDGLTHGATHGGVVAVCGPLPTTSEVELLSLLDGRTAAPLLLLLEGIQDDRNLGFTLRSAEALGATAVLLKKHVFDFDETEVSRTSSGAFERLPLVRIDRETELLRELERRGLAFVGCIGRAERTIYEVDLRGPTILCIGGEKRGLSAAVRRECTTFARIPMASHATSLSMPHAAAVLLAEAARQRLNGGNPKESPP